MDHQSDLKKLNAAVLKPIRSSLSEWNVSHSEDTTATRIRGQDLCSRLDKARKMSAATQIPLGDAHRLCTRLATLQIRASDLETKDNQGSPSKESSWTAVDVRRIGPQDTSPPNLKENPQTSCPFTRETQIKLWHMSREIGRGTYGYVRELISPTAVIGHEKLPVTKLAVEHKKGLRMIDREYRILRKLRSFDPHLPVLSVDSKPLLNTKRVIIGFRMEKLVPISLEDLVQRGEEVERAVTALHNAGYVHGDLHCGNIMLSEQSNGIRLIDFGSAGKIGAPVDEWHSARIWNGFDVFDVRMDVCALENMWDSIYQRTGRRHKPSRSMTLRSVL